MDKSEPPSSYPPADFRRRALARCIDLLVAAAPLLLVQRGHRLSGEILAAGLLLTSDALFGPGRSLGKRLAGLRVIHLAARRAADTRDSMVRNGIFVPALLPALAGAPLSLTLGAIGCIALIEAMVATRPLTRDLGQRRLGDLLAGTQVVDASIAIGLPASPPAETPRAAAPIASRAALTHTENNRECASP